MTRTESAPGYADRPVGSAAADRRLAGGLFLLAGAGFVTVLMLAAAMAPDYVVGPSAISDLGVVPETALLFNASLVGVGVLNVVAGALLYRVHGSRRLLVPFVLAGVGAAGAGLFTLDDAGVHGLFALLAFVFFNVQALAVGTRLTGPMRAVSVLAGLVGLAFVVVMAVGDAGTPAVFGPVGHGGAERLIVYPPMVWLVAFGGFLLGADPEVLAPAATDDAT
jgi:hypothetical membrane protein